MSEPHTSETPLCGLIQYGGSGTAYSCVLFEGHRGGHELVRSSEVAAVTKPHVDTDAEAVTATSTIAEELAAWWRQQAESEIDQTVAKATEYSGTQGGLPQDLVTYGREWVFASGRSLDDYTDAQLAEVGIWCYLIGKLGRWSSALRNGRMVSGDTLLDIAVYSRMASRIREAGQWP